MEPAESRLRWTQIEPRRRYRTETSSHTYDLLWQGRTAPEVGWYLEGGLDGQGHQFMGKRLHDAATEAERRIAAHHDKEQRT